MDTNTFLRTHRVFNLADAAQALTPSQGRGAALDRIKYHVWHGRSSSFRS